MSVKLQIKQPPITSYQQIALPLTVAMMNPTAENWFYSNYIQVGCVNRRHYLSKGNCDNALHYAFYNPEKNCQESNEHICIEGCEQLYLFRNPNFIKGAIDDGWYIYTDADMFYIDGNPFFKMSHFAHDMMIYGYDEDNVYIYMYDDNKLSSHTVSYDNFLHGYYSEYCNETCYRNRAILFKPNSKVCKVNLEKIRWHMHDYLNGTETFAREKPNIFNPDALSVHGINTYAEFENLFDYVIEGENKYLRRTDMYCLYEHKKVMYDRVIYLKSKELLSASEGLIKEYEKTLRISQILMMLGLKLNGQRDASKQNYILVSLKEHIQKLKINEETAWNRYIAENREVLG